MSPAQPPLETTASLLALIRDGDAAARDRLLVRCYKPLLRFAHGRVPARAQSLTDTEDLVQMAILRALDHIEGFDAKREGAFLAYLRRIVINLITDEARRTGRHPEQHDLTEDLASSEASPLEEAIGREALERYDAALANLSDGQREAVILRVEMGYTYAQIGDAIGATSADAARMTVTRAIARLATLMRVRDTTG